MVGRSTLACMVLAVVIGTTACSSSAPKVGAGSLELVALGDSVAAGLPNGDEVVTKTETGWSIADRSESGRTAADRMCGRSSKAWPVRFGAKVSARVRSVACSGATVRAGLLGSQGSAPPQVDALRASTDIVTLTVGANDAAFLNTMTSCYLSVDTCDDASADASLDRAVTTLRTELAAGLDQIRTRSPKATIVLTTYYDPVPTAAQVRAGCSEVVVLRGVAELDRGEAAWLRAALHRMNDVIRNAAAARQRVVLVDLERAFDGHQLCDADPWVFGPSILLQPGQFQNSAPLHPTPDGQAAIARAAQVRFAARAG
jgi:lysophospholipase L1-like esterase